MLAAAMCLTAFTGLTGCSVLSKGSDYCESFLKHIIAGEYSEAYDMIADSVKKDDPEGDKELKATPTPTASPTAEPTPDDDSTPTPDPDVMEYPDEVEPTLPPEPTEILPISPVITDNPSEDGTASRDAGDMPAVEENGATPTPGEIKDTPVPTATATPTPSPSPSPTPQLDKDGNPIIEKLITRKEFVEKYQSVFDELQLTGIDYEITDVVDGDILGQISYTLTYHSERGGDLTYDFKMTANRIEYRWMIDWSPNLIFPMMEWGDNVRVGILQANRGEILCDGEPYAQNVNIITVFAVPSTVIANAKEEAEAAGLTEPPTTEQAYADFARKVAAIPELGLTEEAVVKALNKQINDFSKLKTFFPDEIDQNMKTTILAVKGLAIDSANYGTQRYYPYGDSLCHVIGYAGIITKEKKLYYERIGDTRYNGDSWIGNYGLEYVYEDTLLGTNGRFTYIQDSKGGSRGMLYKTDAVDGKDLHLTIKPEIQERLEDIVDNVVYDSSIHGAVVVMNPKTGEIQAMTSFPGFDLNYLARGMPEEEWEAMKADPEIPLYNRATQGLYTPGSVFKTMTSAALIETNTMSISDVFPASEQAYIKGDEWTPSDGFMNSMAERKSPNSWKEQSNPDGDKARPLRRTENTNRHTPMNMYNSIIDSDNLFFAYGAMRMGWTKLEKYLVDHGWNEALELERQKGVTDENTGLDKCLETSVPQVYDITKAQNDYDLAVTGYGQGQILVSPLQMATFVSAYANDGVAMQPYVVDSIWHASGTDYSLIEQREPKIWKTLFDQSTVDAVLPALREVCLVGTARNLTTSFISRKQFSLGYTFAGKTGTAEITNDKSRELAWFVCWRDKKADTGAPVTEEDARLVCIMLEVSLPMKLEWNYMKMDIARSLLKDDVLNS